MLEIDHLSNLIPGRYTIGHRAQVQDGREIATAPVDLGDQRQRQRSQSRRIDDQRQRLPLVWRKTGGVGQIAGHITQRAPAINLGGDGPNGRFDSQSGRHLLQMFRRERMGVVQQ